MFSKLKSGTSSASQGAQVLSTNNILNLFEVGKYVCSAGPELIWKVYEGFRKPDGKEVSIFVFEKKLADKLHKPRRKETVTEILKKSVHYLEMLRQPKLILKVVHSVEDCNETLAFAAEPVIASLANILAYQASIGGRAVNGPPSTGASITATAMPRPAHAKEYNFLDFEIKYGIRQIAEALDFLSPQVHHHNVCPSSILVTKTGTWKLSGLEFIVQTEARERITCTPWTSRLPKMAQPDLDYIAPEVQLSSYCSSHSDMFSLGMVIFAIFNNGRPLIQANHSSSTYMKQLDVLENQIHNVLPKLPAQLQEMATKMLSKDVDARPFVKNLLHTPYFCDRFVETIQTLDIINMKDLTQKCQFYKITLKESLPFIPKKIWYQRVWPFLQHEMMKSDVSAAVLHPVIFLIQESSLEDYETLMLPAMSKIFNGPKHVPVQVILLENLHVILEKTPRDDIRKEVLPLLYTAFDFSDIEVQSTAVLAVTNVSQYMDDTAIRRMVLPKLKMVYETNPNDLKIILNILACLEIILHRLEKQQIIEDVLPLLWIVNQTDPEVIARIAVIYSMILRDKKYGLSVNMIATKIMPTLIPHTMNPGLNLEQFQTLIEVLQDMLEQIDRNQRNKLKLDTISMQSPDRHRPLRHLYSSDNMHAQNFNIPNLKIEQRKTSSAEDMVRKNSAGSWWFGGSPSGSDSNFLRVVSSFPNRRLSDNMLNTPKIRVAPSCASSPGSTPVGTGLPIRRHSNVERRGSTINLSPPSGYQFFRPINGHDGFTLSVPSSTYGGSMPNTSSSVPYLLSSSMNSIRSRRQSTCSQNSSTGILQQLGSGVVKQLSTLQNPYQLFSGNK
ncbi:SCY1-like protein 2 isoform X1 [Sipha flava]|uniref:SCY1-like protein 2 isoform X1 n=1 Tax=Sipha flava TaxID=143950 RepID=A0A8B8G5B7_9HEMI|nr:SCY1-like protein 2 isoform X1 [Sipha flava]XP_025418020.1 SCY1-like protein 2 isoform X1 [Sipha flava]XP_025418021.1 SCY1-like protein 2 isoform X1 [Sipha flava]XP_025418022.1 SCY1-like protein 2 isoform X1 [Sipha flava]XP_025418023.1 SCY1-like protein 2 isoform X1 [Sipha flava]